MSKKIKESSVQLLKKLKKLIQTPLFLEVVSGFKVIISSLKDESSPELRKGIITFCLCVISVLLIVFVILLSYMTV